MSWIGTDGPRHPTPTDDLDAFLHFAALAGLVALQLQHKTTPTPTSCSEILLDFKPLGAVTTPRQIENTPPLPKPSVQATRSA